MSRTHDKIFIAGNGPSLREVDFQALRHTHWLGMNAAYRYWDEIGIYPTIYCCLDKVVIKHHAAEIERLHKTSAVDRFFLVRDVLEEIPGLESESNVFFLEDLVNSEDPNAAIFRTHFSDKKTTGSWAVRFAIYCGYTNISLCGIDCSYVEILPEAEKTGEGIELIISSPVTKNPNYFFDSYQKPGDLYQIPNPSRHFGNLHLQSFEALNVDIQRLKLAVTINNTAKSSQLHRYGVYDYMPPSYALGYSALSAVAVPLTIGECEQFLANIAVWDTPAFLPLRLDSPLIGKIALHLFFDSSFSELVIEKLNAAWNSTRHIKFIFAALQVTFLNIPRELNYYIRQKDTENVSRKMGPNVHFLCLMKECKKYNSTFLMEVDCIPTKTNWLSVLSSYCTWSAGFWIAGSAASPLDSVDPALAFQINGNAIYATGSSEFQEFLDKVFTPTLLYLIFEQGSRDLAYDCLCSKVLSYGSAFRERKNRNKSSDPRLMKAFENIQCNLHRFHLLHDIKNISHLERELSHEDLVELLDSEHTILHSKRLTDVVCAAYRMHASGFSLEYNDTPLARRFKDTFIKINQGDIFAYHYYSNLDGYVFDRFDRSECFIIVRSTDEAACRDCDENKGAYVIFALGEIRKGDYLHCSIVVTASTSQKILVRFSRHGKGAFSQDTQEVDVNEHSSAHVTLSFICRDGYDSARLFVKQTGGNAGSLRFAYMVRSSSQSQDRIALKALAPSDASKSIYALFFASMQSLPDCAKLESARLSGPQAQMPVENESTICEDSDLSYPRLLMIDSTPLGHASATGQLKQTFLEKWPSECFLQVWETGGQKAALHLLKPGQSIAQSRSTPLSTDVVLQTSVAFQPDVIYFRPIDSMTLFAAAERIVENLDRPLVIHMMDDWPERLRVTKGEKYVILDKALRRLIARANRHLSICNAMSISYSARYGGYWEALANGIDIGEFSEKNWNNRRQVTESSPFVIRYMGGLADDMNFESIKDIALVVASLSDKLPIVLQIFTMDWYRAKAEQELGALPSVQINSLVDAADYRTALSDADALVIAYNFDAASISYIGLSLANKMPECLASGVPLLAYGPAQVATISYLRAAGCAKVVDERNPDVLREAVQSLVTQPETYRNMGRDARTFVANNINKGMVQRRFLSHIRQSQEMATTKVHERDTSQEGHHVARTSHAERPSLAETTSSHTQAYKVDSGPGFERITATKWRCIHGNEHQKLWIAAFDGIGPTSGREFVTNLAIRSDRQMVVQASLGRHGVSDYEGNSTIVTLLPDEPQNIRISKEFSIAHQGLKVQLEVLDLLGSHTAELTIEPRDVNETVRSVVRRTYKSGVSFREANRRFREGDALAAMAAFLALYEKNPLSIYADNALASARKLGNLSAGTIDDLLRQFT